MALTGVLAAGAVSLLFVKMMNLKLGYALGLFAGSGTSTPTLQAAIATLGNDDPAVGYSVAYPFGVAGPILFLYIAFMVLKPKIEAPTGGGMEMLEIAVRNPELSGKSLAELTSSAARRRADRRAAPRGPQRAGLAQFRPRRKRRRPRRRSDEGSARAGRHAPRRSRARPFRQRPRGPRLPPRLRLAPARSRQERSANSTLPGEKASVIIQVRRGDADIQPRPDLVLESGDRVGVLAHRGDFAAMRKFFGDSIKTHRRVQLHLHRHRHGARLPDRRDPDSAAGHRQDFGRTVGRAHHGARSSANCAAPAA